MPDRLHDSLPTLLRDDVRTLGSLLGQVIKEHRGQAFLDGIETIRALAKQARDEHGTARPERDSGAGARVGDGADWQRLSDYLTSLPDADLVDVARAFNQFLNLANIAEQHHAAHRVAVSPQDEWRSLAGSFDLQAALADTRVELVLTAHPTEVLRRTLIQKYDAIATELTRDEGAGRNARLKRLIAEAWHTDEIRRERPTPQDEARWGFAVVENSLWRAVPDALRAIDQALIADGATPLPPSVMPLRFASWMGGDRDGNPNVTASVTDEVLGLARWMAADLYLRDVEVLIGSLSMSDCSAELRALAGSAHEPYREVLKSLRGRLTATRDWAEGRGRRDDSVIVDVADLLEPLECCYRSLLDRGMQTIARGELLDTLRRVHCFGVHLVDLDVRQNADRHEQVFDELTRYLDPAETSYGDWDEAARQAFLIRELSSRRPLFPAEWPASADAREVLDTCAVIAREPAVAEYIISMAATPSDVLAVILLLREAAVKRKLLVVPLFETLADLEGAAATLDALLSNDWYRDYVRATGDRQQVMIGYSDSAKDAGQLAAAWAQYRAQEQLAAVAAQHGVRLTLFHGRGGAIGRGGGPAHQAILSQPPGSLGGSLRVTEQGEMIRFKLGTPAVALDTINRYLTATLEATLRPPPEPTAVFREAMDDMAGLALGAYRQTVRGEPGFVALFQALTPERELAELALGSRPARRKPSQDVESLRAIPWVFAWTQVRLMLPAWLGTEAAVDYLRAHRDTYEEMLSWPFFRMQSEMLEMMVAKAEPTLVRYYASRLCGKDQQSLVDELVGRLDSLASALLTVRGHTELLADQQELADSLQVRNTYLDPLHLLQAELLTRLRNVSPDAPDGTPRSDLATGAIASASPRSSAPDAASAWQEGMTATDVVQALKVTMAGISSGLRNTG